MVVLLDIGRRVICFNSTLVQLKATRPNLQHEPAIRFNSTLVQLKVF